MRPVIECWCCGQHRPHYARSLCMACWGRWKYRGFTGPGPGPSQKPPITESAREYADLINSMPAWQAAQRLGLSERTIRRWRAALREAS
jgi:hypothetical protein